MKRLSILLAAIAGSLALGALAQSEPPVTSGLLLGLRGERGGVTTYRTLWIAPQKGALKLVAQAQDVLVPRSSGWWRVGQGRYQSGSGDWVYDIDAPWAVPVKEKPWVGAMKFDTETDQCNSVGRFKILFVGPDQISLETDQGGFCEGAAHPWQSNNLNTYPLETFRYAPEGWGGLGGNPDQALKFQTVFSGRVSALLDAGTAFYAKQDADQHDRLSAQPEETAWGLVRRAGNWVVRGRLNYGAEAARGSFADFDVPVTAPAAMTGTFGQGFSLEEIKAGLPDATDFVFSPARDVLAVVRPSGLRVEHVWGGKPARKLAVTVPLGRGEAIVMAQWATGNGLKRWQTDVPALLKR
jgi:hypothetical protein